MRLGNLIDALGLTLAAGSADVEITDVCDDSRLVKPGALFIARGGPSGAAATDGNTYIADAIARGAVAIVSETSPTSTFGIRHSTLPPPAPAWITARDVDQSLCGRIAEAFFDHPSRKLKLIGITGTNGKTTIAFLIQHLLREATPGVPCGMIGTVVIDDGKTRSPATLTTPGAIDFSRYLAAMVAHGCQAAVAEVSSHALDQGRVGALHFDAAVFTNLTGDHLDYHKTMENYGRAKARLFENLAPQAFAIVNGDDPFSAEIVRNCRAHVVRCGIGGGANPSLPLAPSGLDDGEREIRLKVESGEGVLRSESEGNPSPAPSRFHRDGLPSPRSEQRGEGKIGVCPSPPVSAQILQLTAERTRAIFDGPWGSQEVEFPLIGRHNVMNVLQAVTAANAIAPMEKRLRQVLKTCAAPPGRLERVTLESSTGKLTEDPQMPTILVDYAHTHDALENVLTTLRQVSPGKLTVVFGCGGDRDRTKRPKMAQVACRLADRVIVTSDNPRTEDPQTIIDEILAGVPGAAGARVPLAGRSAALGGAADQCSSHRPARVGSEDSAGPWHPTPDAPPALIVEPDRAAAIALAIASAEAHEVVLLAGKGHEDYQIIGKTKHHFDDREHAAEALKRRLPRRTAVATGA